MSERYEQRRRDVQREEALLVGLRGHELLQARKNRVWAAREEAIEVAVDEAAHRLARRQAASGDAQALGALKRAGQLSPALVSEVRRIRSTPRESPAPVAPGDAAPISAVREALAAQREAGVDFNEAWPRAVAHLPRGGPRQEGIWRLAVESTINHWRAAFEGTDDQGAAQVAGLAQGLDATDDWSEVPPTTMAAA